MREPQRRDFRVQIKPASGGKKQFVVTTPHGEIKRTTARDYEAVAYSVRAGGVSSVSFSSTLTGAYRAAQGWDNPDAYYGLLLTGSETGSDAVLLTATD